MIGKLLSLISTTKGAAAAAVIAAAGVGTGVVATNSDVQNALGGAVQNAALAKAEPSGRPAVVAARNDADKKLREAFQDDQRKLEKLRGTKVESADRTKLEDVVKTADEKLRARLTKALDDVAALTLGREGRESASPKPSASPDVKATFTSDAQAKIDAVVKAAVADMDAMTADAEKAVAALPTANPGKPADAGKPGERPASPAAKPTR